MEEKKKEVEERFGLQVNRGGIGMEADDTVSFERRETYNSWTHCAAVEMITVTPCMPCLPDRQEEYRDIGIKTEDAIK
jgi:hypothetical protein